MNSRERLLVIAVAGLFGFLGLKWGVQQMLLGPLEAKKRQIANLDTQIESADSELLKAKAARLYLNLWKTQALPANVSIAQTLYHEYLRGLFVDSSIDRPTITTLPAADQGGHFQKLTFSIRAKCRLDQLARFLYQFGQAPYLQAIRRLDIKPEEKGERVTQFDVQMTIEALAFADAVATDALPAPPPVDPKANPPLQAEALALFAEKNVFQPTQIVNASAPTTTPTVARTETRRDDRAQVFLMAIVSVNGAGEIWLNNRNTSRVMVVRVGGELRIDGMRAQLESVSEDRAVLTIEGQPGEVRLLDTLDRWQPIAIAKKKSAEAASESTASKEDAKPASSPTEETMNSDTESSSTTPDSPGPMGPPKPDSLASPDSGETGGDEPTLGVKADATKDAQPAPVN